MAESNRRVKESDVESTRLASGKKIENSGFAQTVNVARLEFGS